jgi:integrase
MRLGEVLGMENGSRCVDFGRQELHVIQQLRHSVTDHGGFYLAPPKAGSAGTVDLDPLVAEYLADHLREFPPVATDLLDTTGPEPVTRSVARLFRNTWGLPITDQRWSTLWAQWRDEAGWPEAGIFHSLRHFCAITMISHGVEPQDVQKALRHANLRITLETYVHWLPKKDRPRGVVGGVLQKAAQERRNRGLGVQDHA